MRLPAAFWPAGCSDRICEVPEKYEFYELRSGRGYSDGFASGFITESLPPRLLSGGGTPRWMQSLFWRSVHWPMEVDFLEPWVNPASPNLDEAVKSESHLFELGRHPRYHFQNG